jgi:quercetin dioxygenase-like cupin family protein
MAGNTAIRQPGEGDAFWMLGGLYEVEVSSADTGGAFTIIQMTLPAGMGPPPHTHPGSESVMVIEGRLRYNIDGKTFDGPAGSSFHVPAGTIENFEPLETTRLLVVYAPGGIEAFFAEAGEPAQRREVPPAPTAPPDLERLTAIGQKYGMQIEAPAAV